MSNIHLINIDSKSVSYTDTITNGVLRLKNPITRTDKEYFTIQLIGLNICNSWYVINSSNDTIYIAESDEDGSNPATPFTITIEHGNYSIDEIISTIQSRLNDGTQHGITYAISYDTHEYKMIISTETVDKKTVFDFSQSDSPYQVLGFLQAEYTMTTTTQLKSPNCFNMRPNRNIYIRTSLVNNQYMLQNSNVLYIQQVNVNKFQYQTNQSKGELYTISNDTIDQIDIQITDYFGNYLELNGVDWFVKIEIAKHSIRQTDEQILIDKKDKLRAEAILIGQQIGNELERYMMPIFKVLSNGNKKQFEQMDKLISQNRKIKRTLKQTKQPERKRSDIPENKFLKQVIKDNETQNDTPLATLVQHPKGAPNEQQQNEQSTNDQQLIS